MASLIWTCAISVDVLMQVNKRKWLWQTTGEESRWLLYRWIYFSIVCLFALPGCILNIINQQRFDSNLGCNAYSEKLGNWFTVFITELLPISLGYLCNIFVYIKVRSRMSLKSFPLSVRKRRRKIMYNYIIVCNVCWCPTIIFYIVQLAG